ncbi:unnamed protein product [Effrenium voratum]|nr:unnamed protein product [Effrenium voratum]
MPGGPSLSGGHGAPGRPHSGASARGEELRSDHELVLAAVAQNGLALQYASKELRKDRAFVLKAVEKTRAWFLVNWAGPELRVDKDFQRRCVDTCSTGLVFTYYESYTAFTNMRSSFLATGASVPGGQAYERVMEQLRNRGDEGAATVWFDKVPAFGAFADAGRWLHPSEECGRDYSPVESCAAESIPEVGSKHPCCSVCPEQAGAATGFEKYGSATQAGAVICCTVSNIFNPDSREYFKNGRPEGWGCGKITIDGTEFERSINARGARWRQEQSANRIAWLGLGRCKVNHERLASAPPALGQRVPAPGAECWLEGGMSAVLRQDPRQSAAAVPAPMAMLALLPLFWHRDARPLPFGCILDRAHVKPVVTERPLPAPAAPFAASSAAARCRRPSATPATELAARCLGASVKSSPPTFHRCA